MEDVSNLATTMAAVVACLPLCIVIKDFRFVSRDKRGFFDSFVESYVLSVPRARTPKFSFLLPPLLTQHSVSLFFFRLYYLLY